MNFVCKQCDTNFTKKCNLNRHQLTHHQQNKDVDNKFECNECNRKFNRKDILVRHIEILHKSKLDSFKCSQCSKTFSNKYSQTHHIRTAHIKTVYRIKKKKSCRDCKVCNLCLKDFASFEGLTFHKKSVHPKRTLEGTNFFRVHDFFKCHYCNKKFFRKDTLKRHIKIKHLLERDDFECAHCSRKYTRKNDLIKHLSKHMILERNVNPKVTHFKCLMCEQFFDTRILINEHYQKYHNIDFEYKLLRFSSFSEFQKWKISEEQKFFIQFSIAMSWNTKTVNEKQYICHRSGEKRLKTAPKIIPKLIGSKKLGGICPALINIKQSKNDGMCSVVYQKIHVGHPCNISELPHMNLNAEDKFNIAKKLSLGVPRNILLGQYESTDNQEICSRINLLNYNDVTNIAKQFNLNEPFPKLFNDDSKNIASFVLKNKNSILFYKEEGIEDDQFPTLKKEDFALGYMNENQERNLKRYGYKTICFDGTHGTNPNDFILHTLLVTDVDSEGYPVAFLLTNRIDEVVISVLLKKIKDRLGTVSSKTIMSDMQSSYFNSWIKKMGPVKHTLFCTWHVHKAWRKNFSKIKNKEKKVFVTKILYDLSTELDKEKFQNKLHAFLSNNDDDLQYFLDYFFKYYGQNQQFWAYCYRQNAGCNTNMNLESFHRVLKEKIMSRLKVKSVYDCLYYLEKYLVMKENDVKKKQIRFKRTNKLKFLRANHKKVEKQSESKIIVINSLDYNSWYVQSFTDEKKKYNVLKREVKECTLYGGEICLLPCTKCNACFHEYTCNCQDHSIKNNMCKHIHAVAMNLLSQKTDSICRQITGKNSTRRRSIHTKMTCKYDQQMDTTRKEEKNELHPDDGTLLHNLRQKILQEIEQSLQQVKSREHLHQINKKLVAPIHVSVAASKIVTVPLKQKNKLERGKMKPQKRIFDVPKNKENKEK